MRNVRRIAVPGLSGALVLAGALWAAPPAMSDAGSVVNVVAGASFRIFAGEVRMGADEFLQVLSSGGSLGTYTVRIYDEATEDLGRPLLVAGSGCVPSGVPTAQTVCTFSEPPQRVGVDFLTATGPTNVAIMDQAAIALDFRGSAGSDYVQGGSGNDWLRGLGGADRLYGGPGDDTLDGGAGDDYLEGEEGRDDMRGGSGSNSIDAVDNPPLADRLVDCGGPPGALFDYDKGLDVPNNCGANPTPIPPAPIEPVDPPEPGQGDGTIDGRPTEVEITPEGDENKQTTIASPQNNIFMNTGLWFGTPNGPLAPTFPPLSNFFPLSMSGLFPGSLLDLSIWSVPPTGPTSSGAAARIAPRSDAISTTAIRVNARGVAEGDVPVPAGQQPGNFVVQVNAVTASGAAATINVGVVLTETTPEPDPGPTETISITSASRGMGKKAATITVSGTTTGLAGTSVTPRYRVQGAKKWTLGKPVVVSTDGAFTFRLVSPKQVSIMVVSGAVKAKAVKVAAVKK